MHFVMQRLVLRDLPVTLLTSLQSSRQRAQVNAMSADHHFESARYIQAAQSYAQSLRTFDEVALRFLEIGQRDALRYYLVSRLERTRKTASD
jgi:vacuolar protein sorting-associated protein 18